MEFADNGNNPELGADAFTTAHRDELNAILAHELTPQQDTETAAPELSGRLTEERRVFRGGEVIKLTPDAIRLDASTGEPVIPLLFIQGMGSERKLPGYMAALALAQEREIIGLQYQGKLQGKTGLVPLEGFDEPVPEMDALQTDDLLESLDELAVTQVDGVFVSRGATRGIAAMARRPELFRDVAIVHGAGLDGRGYGQAHVDAAREWVHLAYDKTKGRVETAEQDLPSVHTADSGLRNIRKQQKSVARADNRGLLMHTLAQHPELEATMIGDLGDKAFLASRLMETAQAVGATFELSEWGGHGFRGNPAAINDVSAVLDRMEAKRQS